MDEKNKNNAVLFDTRELESYLEQIRNGKLKDFTDNGDSARGIAVLEYPTIDVEVNLFSKGQLFDERPNDQTPAIRYFCCKTDDNGEWYSDSTLDYEPQVDWSAEDWRYQLMIDMHKALQEYSEKDGYVLQAPDRKLLKAPLPQQNAGAIKD